MQPFQLRKRLTRSLPMRGLLPGGETDPEPATKDAGRGCGQRLVLWEMEAGLGTLLGEAGSDVKAQHPCSQMLGISYAASAAMSGGWGTRASPGPTSHGGGRLARNRQWRETEFPRGHPSSRVKITFCYTSNSSVEQNRPLLLPLVHLLYGNHSRVVASECPVPWGNQCRRDLRPWAHSAAPCLSPLPGRRSLTF